MNIICTGNKNKKDFYDYLNKIIKHINAFNTHNIYVDEYVSNDINNINAQYESLYSNKIQFDFAISIGGDGALLSAVRRMKDRQLPVLGIHIGNLGFLNTATKKNYIASILVALSPHEKKKPLKGYEKTYDDYVDRLLTEHNYE